MYYYGYRYYSAELGRWINKDPIGELGGLNVYLFCQNNPIDTVDLLGLDTLRAKIFAYAAQGNWAEAIALAEAGGYAAFAARFQQLQASIQTLIAKYPAYSFRCVDLANKLYKAFTKAKYEPQILRLKGVTDFLIDGGGKVFSQNGKHYIVRIGDRVYDAFTGASGMLYTEYVTMWTKWMGCPPQVTVLKGLAK